MTFKLICSIAVFSSTYSFAQPANSVVDKIAAQVGDNIILLSEIQAQKLQAIQAKVEITPQMDCEILEELMFQELLINQAALL